MQRASQGRSDCVDPFGWFWNSSERRQSWRISVETNSKLSRGRCSISLWMWHVVLIGCPPCGCKVEGTIVKVTLRKTPPWLGMRCIRTILCGETWIDFRINKAQAVTAYNQMFPACVCLWRESLGQMNLRFIFALSYDCKFTGLTLDGAEPLSRVLFFNVLTILVIAFELCLPFKSGTSSCYTLVSRSLRNSWHPCSWSSTEWVSMAIAKVAERSEKTWIIVRR